MEILIFFIQISDWGGERGRREGEERRRVGGGEKEEGEGEDREIVCRGADKFNQPKNGIN